MIMRAETTGGNEQNGESVGAEDTIVSPAVVKQLQEVVEGRVADFTAEQVFAESATVEVTEELKIVNRNRFVQALRAIAFL